MGFVDKVFPEVKNIMQLGIDILLEKNAELIRNKRVGILAHAASVNAKNKHTVERIMKAGCSVAALFGPEHGISTAAEDMEEVHSTTDAKSGVPIFSLYGSSIDSLKPTKEMLNIIDTLVIDLQDIGSRYYTYVWTACLCVEACGEMGKPVVVCDRPNPIGGISVEGGGIDGGFESFVGLYSLPNRHGMTIGEIVQFVNGRQNMGCDLEVIKMDGWRRETKWAEAGLKWTNPSPNMRSYTAALLYPGMCLLEGTNFSEGRGTDTPFEIVGAPYADAEKLVKEFNALSLPGVKAVPTAFIPTKQKWHGNLCNGVRFVISDEKEFRPYLTGLIFVWLVKKMYGGSGFEWRAKPYEFVTNRPAIDLLTGSAKFRMGIDNFTLEDLKEITKTPEGMIKERKKALLY